MKALVTGGGGYLGAAITRQLIERGDQVTILARGRYPDVEALGAHGIQADLTDAAALAEAVGEVLPDIDVVFHTAAVTGPWGSRDWYMRINVDGTKNLLELCQLAGVRRFVFTGSPSCTFDGSDVHDATEQDVGYPEKFESFYSESKAIAEQLALGCHGPDMLVTSLRPHLIYGPAEPHMIPRVLDRHASGRLRRIGDGTPKMGLTYIDNAAAAHVQAADALGPDSANGGKAYFITDGGFVVFWQWLDALFEGIGVGKVKGQIGQSAALKAAGAAEWTWRTLGLKGEPPITRFAVTALSTSHWYDVSAARNDFGYAPLVDGDDGLRRTIDWFRAHR